mmetsp:Transcript_18686/g.30517  ORF Transcript_18686/g.30517 Transcript_18686/m.30517 type:complete len:140 (+) Transcript_18686:150-569(+)
MVPSVASASITLALLTASASSAAAFSTPRHRHHRPSRQLSFRATAETSIGHDQNGLFNLNGMWELGLIDDSFANKTKEDVSRCLNEVVGLSREDAELVTSQAQQHGVSLIEEFPLEYAEAYLEELTSRGIVCEMVPIEE